MTGNFGIFLERMSSDKNIISHEIFHITHRMLEYVGHKFSTDNSEVPALLNGYLTEIIFNMIYDNDKEYHDCISNKR